MIESDAYLTKKIKNNDEIAYKVIFNKFYPRLYYFVLEFIPSHDLAENIVQDTFLVLWNKRNELKENTNLSAYLFSVAKKNCLYRLRDQKYKQRLITNKKISDDLLNANTDALESLDTSVFAFREIEEIINKTLDELPPQCRKVFIMSRFKEKKNREIAEELNISVKAVEGHISKSLKKFRVAFKDYLPLVIYLFIS